MEKEYMDKVVKRVINDGLEVARETNNTTVAFDMIFGFIQQKYESYIHGYITKSEYDYLRKELESEMEKYF